MRWGDADLVLVHNPKAEHKFLSKGYGVNPSANCLKQFRDLGPKDDPAHTKRVHDAVAAFNL